MQIKQQMLAQQLQKKIAPLYVLIGQDNYLLEDSLIAIKSAIKNVHEFDEKIISIQVADDWNKVLDEANSYSLFADTILLTIHFDKKSIDATGKKILSAYLNSVNSRCFIILRAPEVPAKQLLWLSAQEQAVVSVAYPLNSAAMKSWIIAQLKKQQISFDPNVPDLIYQYTQGNMLACAQVIEKITLSNEPNCQINRQNALEHLSDQCDYVLFELIDACLLGQSDKVIQILRHAANNKTEATLVLWMLAQEIRILVQLSHLVQVTAHPQPKSCDIDVERFLGPADKGKMAHKMDLKTACNQLKVWPQRVNLYQASLPRLNQNVLQQLLHYCHGLDEQIKSNLNTQVWNSLEILALSLSLGRFMG